MRLLGIKKQTKLQSFNDTLDLPLSRVCLVSWSMFTHILEKNIPRIALEVYKKKIQALGTSLRQYIESSDIYFRVIPEYYYDFYASAKAL